MKIRNGFVSNSSSSSFVIMTTKEAHDAVVSQLNEYGKAVVEALVENREVFGKKTYIYGDLDVQGYSYSIDEGWQPDGWEDASEKRKVEHAKEDGEYEYSPGETMWEYKDLVQKQPKDTWFCWNSGI